MNLTRQNKHYHFSKLVIDIALELCMRIPDLMLYSYLTDDLEFESKELLEDLHKTQNRQKYSSATPQKNQRTDSQHKHITDLELEIWLTIVRVKNIYECMRQNHLKQYYFSKTVNGIALKFRIHFQELILNNHSKYPPFH